VLATYAFGVGNERIMSIEGGVTRYFAWAGGQIIADYGAWGRTLWSGRRVDETYIKVKGRLK
jgi:hypothetical protein